MARYIGILMLLCSVLTFCGYGLDKLAAKRNAWRTPEIRLLFLGFAGGGLGALLGMVVFHHKTRKPRFWIVNWVGFIWQTAFVFYLLLRMKGRI